MSIRNKLLGIIFLSIFATVGVVSVYVYIEMNRLAIEDFKSNSRGQLDRISQIVSSYMDSGVSLVNAVNEIPGAKNANNNLTSYANTTETTSTDRHTLNEFEQKLFDDFALLKQGSPGADLLYIGTEDTGFLQYPVDPLGPGYNPLKRDWYIAAKAAQKILVTEAYLSDSGQVVTTVCGPLYDPSNRMIGVVGVDFNLDGLVSITSGITIGKTGYVMLMEQSGLILSDPKHKDVAMVPLNELRVPGLAELVKLPEGTNEIMLDGKERLVTVLDSPTIGWRMAVVIDKAEITDSAQGIVLRIAGIAVAIGLIVLVSGWFFARSIARPIEMLVGSANRLAHGDFNALPEERIFKGELLNLRNSLKSMVDNIAQSLDENKKKAEEAEEQSRLAKQALLEADEAKVKAENARKEGIQSTVERLLGVTQNIGEASGTLASFIEKAYNSADLQLARSNEAALAMEEVNESVLNVAENAQNAASSADQAKLQALDGGNIVNEVINTIGNVNRVVSEMKENLNNLSVQADDIGGVMTVISDIADQTNLLALNAAIEAARAGDSGRGFAVVADEVRKLAEKTMQATQEVDKVVNAMQTGMNSNIEVMDRVTGLVDVSTEQAAKSGEALAQIVEISQTSADQVQSIAAAAEQQAKTTGQVSQNTLEVTHISNDVSEIMTQSNQAVHNLTQLTQELQNIITDLQKDS